MKEKYAKWKEHNVDEYADLLRDEMEANGLHPERHEQTIMSVPQSCTESASGNRSWRMVSCWKSKPYMGRHA